MVISDDRVETQNSSRIKMTGLAVSQSVTKSSLSLIRLPSLFSRRVLTSNLCHTRRQTSMSSSIVKKEIHENDQLEMYIHPCTIIWLTCRLLLDISLRPGMLGVPRVKLCTQVQRHYYFSLVSMWQLPERDMHDLFKRRIACCHKLFNKVFLLQVAD